MLRYITSYCEKFKLLLRGVCVLQQSVYVWMQWNAHAICHTISNRAEARERENIHINLSISILLLILYVAWTVLALSLSFKISIIRLCLSSDPDTYTWTEMFVMLFVSWWTKEIDTSQTNLLMNHRIKLSCNVRANKQWLRVQSDIVGHSKKAESMYITDC